MSITVFDAFGRPKVRNDIPVASGQFVENGIAVQSNGLAFVAAGASLRSLAITSVTVVGDGVNGMIFEASLYGPFVSAGTPSHFNVDLWDGTIGSGTIIGSAQQRTITAGNDESGSAIVRGYLAPFTGTKTISLAFTSGAAQTIQNQASVTAPTILTAQWAHPARVTGPSSPPAIEWFSPTFLNGWVNYSDPNYGGIQYGKTPDQTVFVKGLCTAPASPLTNIFQLPAGFRPASPPQRIFVGMSSAGAFDLRVSSDGYVFPTTVVVNGSWVSLSTISFVAEQ